MFPHLLIRTLDLSGTKSSGTYHSSNLIWLKLNSAFSLSKTKQNKKTTYFQSPIFIFLWPLSYFWLPKLASLWLLSWIFPFISCRHLIQYLIYLVFFFFILSSSISTVLGQVLITNMEHSISNKPRVVIQSVLPTTAQVLSSILFIRIDHHFLFFRGSLLLLQQRYKILRFLKICS